MKTQTENRPFWEIPCNPVTMQRVNRESDKSFDKNAYNKKYYEKNNE